MKVSTILDYIDGGHMALPEFQRGYVWNRDQVRGLMGSLYRRHPVGSLLVWGTEAKDADHRGDNQLAPGIVKLLLDGQQRITSLYGIIRGKAPAFFEGDTRAFTDLYFNLETEEFSFYMPKKMQGDILWVDVTKVMQNGIGDYVSAISANQDLVQKVGKYINSLNQIHGIKDIEFHIEEVTGSDKTIDVVVDIFNRVNSGGTTLSKGDLALAKVCSDWPDARMEMRKAIDDWADAGYSFDLDWLLRSVNTIATGEAKFNYLHNVSSDDFRKSLTKAINISNYLLDILAGRFGLDHARVLFGRYAFPVLTHYIDRQGGSIEGEVELNKLLFWYLHCALWGKFSNSTESTIDKDLELIENIDGGLDRLISDLRLWRGDFRPLEDEGDIFEKAVPAWNLYFIAEWDNIGFSFEQVKASKSFLELDAEEDSPAAWNTEIAWYPSATTEFALRYERAKEIPDEAEQQVGIQFSWRPANRISFSVEYIRQKFRRDFVFDDSDREIKSGNIIAGSFSYIF